VPFEPLPHDVALELKTAFPNFVAPGNTVDVWAVADEMEVIPRSLEILAASGHYDVLLGLIDLAIPRDIENEPWLESTMRSLARVTQGTEMFPAVISVHNGDAPPHLHELSRELDLALLRGPRDGIRALASVALWQPPAHGPPDNAAPVEIADLLVGRAGALPELESAALLARYGVPFAPHGRAATPDEAAHLAAELGSPLVVKSDGDAHKSRSGGVILGVKDPAEAAQAGSRLGYPVLVAKQVPAGPEVLVGMTRDPDYGPVLAVGLGGVQVEQLGPVALALGPIDLAGARALVASARIPDEDVIVAATVVALARVAIDHPEIESIDVNPLVLAGSNTVAVDALVVLQSDPCPTTQRAQI
jgi:acetyltransferase